MYCMLNFDIEIGKDLSQIFSKYADIRYRLCGIVVRVPGYRFRGAGFDSRHYQIF
jgi:hypothetical protein